MKLKIFSLLLFFLGITGSTIAQDKLLDRKGNEYLVKVLEILPDSIIYKQFADSAQNTSYIIAKSDVFMITYKNGVKEVFKEKSEPKKAELTNEQLYQLGRKDAKNYHSTKGAYWGTLGATMVYPLGGPLLGIATGTVISVSKVANRNIMASKPELKQNKSYLDGYQNQAKSKKLGSAAGGFATGLGIYTLLIIIIIGQIN